MERNVDRQLDGKRTAGTAPRPRNASRERTPRIACTGQYEFGEAIQRDTTLELVSEPGTIRPRVELIDQIVNVTLDAGRELATG